jgi:hypothetical protein
LLQFGEPMRFDLDVGLDDQTWLRKESDTAPGTGRGPDEGLF